MLHCTVGIQESTGQAGDLDALPGHQHSGFFCYNSHTVGFQILGLSCSNKCVSILCFHHYSHAFLRLRDSKFSTVQAFIFLTNSIQVDAQAFCQLTDSYRNAACAKVIAALNKIRNLGIPEQALNLPLFRSITLLNFRCHSCEGLHIVALGRAGSAANAVTTGATTQQHYHITGRGAFTAHIACRCSCHHSTTFQAFGNKAIVVKLSHMSCSKADLVAVGRITGSSRLTQLALGQLAGNRVAQGHPGITGTGNTHRLMHIGTA